MRLLRELGPIALRTAISRELPVLLPAGCIECHGNHLPLGTDTIIAEAVARGVAERIDVVVAPSIDYGPTGYAVSGPELGTVDVPAEPFYDCSKAVIGGLIRLGFRSVFILVHHQGLIGPEAAAFHFAGAAIFNEQYVSRGMGWWGQRRPEPVPVIQVIPTIPADIENEVIGDHAGQTETSLLLHVTPELVDLNALQAEDFWYTG